MKNIAITYTPYLTKAAVMLAGIAALALFLYGFLLLEAVGNTADRAQAERQIRTLASHISSLEEEYLTLTREMTLERAQAMGFVTPKEIHTIVATAASRSLSHNR